jgi:cytochrome b561
MQQNAAYSRLQIGLHWLIAVLIGVNYIVSDGMGRALRTTLEGKVPDGWTPAIHVWVGVAVLVLVILRMIVRVVSGAPSHDTGRPLLDRAGLWGHYALYALLIVVPGLGAATWFLGIRSAGDLHVVTMNIMMLLILGHAAMALLHQYVLKDGLLLRMMRAR